MKTIYKTIAFVSLFAFPAIISAANMRPSDMGDTISTNRGIVHKRLIVE